jgi:predicted dehydrogenase
MTVLAINMRRMSPYRGSNTDVDVILDLMIHDLDLALDLIAQEPGAVNAYGFTALNGAIDHAMAHLDFESGPFLTITASRITEQKIRSIEIAAQNAYLEADLLNKSIAVHRSTIGEYLSHQQQGVKYRQESIIERIHVPTFEPLLLELQHFTDCILTNKPPLVSVRDGFRAMRLAAAIRDTIRDRLINATARPTTKLIQNKSIVPFWSTG